MPGQRHTLLQLGGTWTIMDEPHAAQQALGILPFKMLTDLRMSAGAVDRPPTAQVPSKFTHKCLRPRDIACKGFRPGNLAKLITLRMHECRGFVHVWVTLVGYNIPANDTT